MQCASTVAGPGIPAVARDRRLNKSSGAGMRRRLGLAVMRSIAVRREATLVLVIRRWARCRCE